MRTRHLRALAGAVALSALAPSSAQAATTPFNTEAAFVAAAGPLTMESFEAPFLFGPSAAFTGFTASATTGVTQASFGATDGANALTTGVNFSSGDSITFTFGAAINSFGINLVDYATTGAPSSLQITTNAGDNLVLASAAVNGSGAAIEYGLINDSASFTTVTITYTGGGGDFISFDELRFGTTGVTGGGPNGVPLPPAVLMGGIALLAVPLRKRFGKR